MVPMLTPMAVCRKLSFPTNPPLIDDHEIAACVGLLCQIKKMSLPQGDDLASVVRMINEMDDIPEKFRQLLNSKTVTGNQQDWRIMLEAGYHFDFTQLPPSYGFEL